MGLNVLKIKNCLIVNFAIQVGSCDLINVESFSRYFEDDFVLYKEWDSILDDSKDFDSICDLYHAIQKNSEWEKN